MLHTVSRHPDLSIGPTIARLRKTHTVTGPPPRRARHPPRPSPAAAVITGTVRGVIANEGMRRVRIMESHIYLGLITGEHPDPDRAARVINALLPGSSAGLDPAPLTCPICLMMVLAQLVRLA